MRRAGLTFLLGGGAMIALFLLSREEPRNLSTESSSVTREREEQGAPPDSVVDAGHSAVEELTPGAQESRRTAEPDPACWTRLLDPEGDPVVGAVSTWTPMRPEFLGLWVDWSRQPWEAIGAATETRSSDGAGRVEFDAAIARDLRDPSALWITHPDYLPHLRMLGPGEVDLPTTIELERAERMRVRVVDERGEPVLGAIVQQLEPVPASAVADFLDPQALRILRREAITDASGWAAVAGWRGETLLEASLGDQRSGVWIGAPRGSIELTLRGTFEVVGTVDYSLGHEMHGPQRVWCSASFGSRDVTQVVAPVIDGSFGPVSLALQGAEGYAFRLEGFNAEVQVVRIAPPEAGALVQVGFVARAGSDVWTQIVDTNGKPVEGAESVASWERDGRVVEVVSHTPAEPGFYPNRGIPAGPVMLRARAPGYVPALTGPVQIPEDSPVSHVLELEPGRVIRGRVTLDGEGVEDFDLVHWSGQSDLHHVEHFRSRSGGQFEVEASRKRVVQLFALAAGCGPSSTVSVEPTSEEPIELQLTRLVRGRGLVTDAATGEPLSAVDIEPFAADGHRAVTPVGTFTSTGLDGRFDCAGFTEGRSRVRFSKAGYSNHWADVFGQRGEVLDLGTIALSSPQKLTVRLVSSDRADFSEYTFQARGEALGRRFFPRSGLIEIENASAGVYYFLVETPGRSLIHRATILSPGEDWVVEIHVDSKRKLRAHFEDNGIEGGRFTVEAHLPNDAGRQTIYASRMTDARVIEYPLTVPGNFEVCLVDEAGQRVAEAQGVVPPGDQDLEVDVKPLRSLRRFRVVAAGGAPVAGGDLAVYDPGTWVGGLCRLDDEGRGTLGGIEARENVARVVHRTAGLYFNIPVLLPLDEAEEVLIQLGPSLTLELELLDGLVPLGGIQCALWEAHRLYAIPPRTTGPDGIVRWDSLGAGPYVVEVHHPDVWPTEAHVELGPESGRARIQARRRGSVTIELRSAQGGLLGSQPIEIDSSEFGESVASWLEDGRVESSTGALRTDAGGELRLSGLPRGAYAWSASGSSGGVFEVRPGAEELAVLTVP